MEQEGLPSFFIRGIHALRTFPTQHAHANLTRSAQPHRHSDGVPMHISHELQKETP
jgi:hypothetical protein